MKKKKILLLSDHALSTSGVGTQSRHLIDGLLKKYPGEWSFRQFGAAIKHNDYRTVFVNDDFIIKPIDGFGSPELLRVALATEKPDILLIFTDPRFFIWLFEMEDEIHQICPIAWWHVWDNDPRPDYNDILYRSTDLINCHSYHTYTRVNSVFPKKANFIPHAVPKHMFFPVSDKKRLELKESLLGKDRIDHFTGIWVNRNAKRKRPADVIWSWKLFLDSLKNKTDKKDATLIMHCDPHDNEGPNLFKILEHFKITDNVVFSRERLEFDKMNSLYNICDFCINISYAEGFGLPTLEAMQTGTPIIAAKTGGLTRQVVDHRDKSQNGVALDIDFRTLVGSQQVPYIYEDYVSVENIAKGMMKLYSLNPDEKKKLREKVLKYALTEFSYDKTIDEWHRTLTDLHNSWNENRCGYKNWEKITF